MVYEEIIRGGDPPLLSPLGTGKVLIEINVLILGDAKLTGAQGEGRGVCRHLNSAIQ